MPKVLIVDDEAAVLKSTAMLLGEMGYETIACSDARDVVALARAERPDVILQDVRMPGLDIDTLVRQIRAIEGAPRIPVVLFSASLDAPAARDRTQASGLVEKPFRPQTLVDALGAALSSA